MIIQRSMRSGGVLPLSLVWQAHGLGHLDAQMQDSATTSEELRVAQGLASPLQRVPEWSAMAAPVRWR